MRKVVYSMGVTLDGFIAGPGGNIDWSEPDEELHRFHNEQSRQLSAHLYGRRLYEVMRFWETADQDASLADHEREFARIWQDTPRYVFSNTLERAEGGATLIRGDIAEEVRRLKEQPGGGMAVGGADLAATFIELGLVDEYGLFVYPVVLGAGTPFFPAREERIELELVETRRFGMGVVYLRYVPVR
jgi:dihydrofolate reductase